MNITQFPYLTNNNGLKYITIDQAIERIQKGTSLLLVNKIRETQDKDIRNDLKKQLPCICFGGEFTKRSKNALIAKSGYMVLDFDDVADVDQKKLELAQDPYTYAVWLSPSGNGLKSLVKVDILGNYEKQFDAITEYFDGLDKSGRDISRICFESYDPGIIVNENSSEWSQEKTPDIYIPVKKITEMSVDKTLENLLKWWSRKYPAVEGQRNTNSFKLACTLFDFGIENVEQIVLQHSNGLTPREVLTLVRSAERKTKENGTIGTKKLETKGLENKPLPVFKTETETGETKEIVIKKTMHGEDIAAILETQVKLRKNEVTQDIELNGGVFTASEDIKLWDRIDKLMSDQGYGKMLNKNKFEAACIIAAEKNSYHPIKEVFETNQWDGKERLNTFLGCFHDQHGVAAEYIKLFMFGCIEKTYKEFQNPILFLTGTPGIGKSTLSFKLAEPFSKYFVETRDFDARNKDHVIAFASSFIFNWGEVSSLSGTKMDALKQIIYSKTITERKPYENRPTSFKTLGNLIMDGNVSQNVLGDPTGLRRFNTVFLTSIDNYLDTDMLQLWMEVYNEWKNDTEKTWQNIDLDKKAKISELTLETPGLWDTITEAVDITKDKNEYVTTNDLYAALSEIDNKFDRNKKQALREVTSFFKQHGIERTKKRVGTKTFWVFTGATLTVSIKKPKTRY